MVRGTRKGLEALCTELCGSPPIPQYFFITNSPLEYLSWTCISLPFPCSCFPGGGGGEIEDYRSKTILAAPPIVDQTMLRAALSLAWLTS